MTENKTENKENETVSVAAEKDAEVKSSGSSIALEARGGIVGVKAGMSQVFDEDGNASGVTVISLRAPNVITQVKNAEKDGYLSVQVGVLDKKDKKASKAEQGRLKGMEQKGFYHYQEFRLADDTKMEQYQKGQVLSIGFVKEGDLVDVSAVSKGKGFQGVMKRYNFGGGPAAHGASVFHRKPGSIGNRADPGRVFKNKKMAGHMGHEKVTIQNLEVLRVNQEEGYILVGGSVPGPRGGIVTLKKAVKA